MAALASATAIDPRRRLFSALAARNRLVAILRIGVPALGLLVFAGLMLQMFVAGLAPDLGFASFSIDRGRLVIDAPGYAAMSADGTSYDVMAGSASSPLGRTDLIDLTDVVLTMRQPSGTVRTATAEEAQLQTEEQLVRVAGVTHVADDSGAHGTLVGLLADVPAETMRTDGAVDMTFANGTTLAASSMRYDGDGTWHFTGVTLVLPSTPRLDRAAPMPAPAPESRS